MQACLQGQHRTFAVLGDEGIIKIGGCFFIGGNSVKPEFRNQPVLKSPLILSPLPLASGEWRTKSYRQLLHRPLELCRSIVPLCSIEPSVPGGGKLRGPVQVE